MLCSGRRPVADTAAACEQRRSEAGRDPLLQSRTTVLWPIDGTRRSKRGKQPPSAVKHNGFIADTQRG